MDSLPLELKGEKWRPLKLPTATENYRLENHPHHHNFPDDFIMKFVPEYIKWS